MDRLVEEAAQTAGIILLPTDDGRSGEYDTVRKAGTELAQVSGADIVLLDRSDESYFLGPYPSGSMTAEVEGPDGSRLLRRTQLPSLGRKYLARQLDEVEAQGVSARAWLPLRPGPKGMGDCVSRFRLGAVVLPATVENPSLRDRVRGETLDKFRKHVGASIFLADSDGIVRVDTTVLNQLSV